MSFADLISGILGFGNVITRSYVSKGTEEIVQKDWDNIKILVNQKGPSQLRQALIVADKTLDAALKEVSNGETMGERLKNAQNKFQWDLYQKIWDAHKIRNSMVHEAGFEPPHHVVTGAIENIKKGLQSLGVKII